MAEETMRTGTGRPPADGARARHLHLSLSRPTQILATFLLAAAASLIAWTVFLGLTLPTRYVAGHWDLLWTGFDIGLLCVLAYGAWAAWFRRQVLATTAVVAGTLLLCDAWFDIVTSIGHRDQWLTLLTGLAGELPLAVFFFWLYRRIVLATLAELHRRIGNDPPPRRLRDARIGRSSSGPGRSDGDRGTAGVTPTPFPR